MPTKIEKDAVTGTETTGHEWDGVRELNTPLPTWWIYTFYASIAFAVVYCVLYPSVPYVTGHTKGLLGYSQRVEVERTVTEGASAQAQYRDKISKASLAEIRKDPDLFAFAQTGGKAVFNDTCVPCHRAGGAGAKGYPSLAAGGWLWGGTFDDIDRTITYGVRNANPESRQSQMPRFGADGILKPQEISDVADFVLSLSGQKAAADAVARGREVYAANCLACHGESGEGNREVGAKNLRNGLWIYGGDKPTLVETITNARAGSMPAWGERFDATTIKMLTVYVHSLGGGE